MVQSYDLTLQEAANALAIRAEASIAVGGFTKQAIDFDAAKQWFSNAGGNIADSAKNLYGTATNAVQDAAGTATNAVQDAAGAVGDAVSGSAIGSQANKVLNPAGQHWGYNVGNRALIGAGAGASAGLLASLFSKKKKKHWLRNAIGGGLLGAGAGAGWGAVERGSELMAGAQTGEYKAEQALAEIDKQIQQAVVHGKDTTALDQQRAKAQAALDTARKNPTGVDTSVGGAPAPEEFPSLKARWGNAWRNPSDAGKALFPSPMGAGAGGIGYGVVSRGLRNRANDEIVRSTYNNPDTLRAIARKAKNGKLPSGAEKLLGEGSERISPEVAKQLARSKPSRFSLARRFGWRMPKPTPTERMAKLTGGTWEPMKMQSRGKMLRSGVGRFVDSATGLTVPINKRQYAGILRREAERVAAKGATKGVASRIASRVGGSKGAAINLLLGVLFAAATSNATYEARANNPFK